MTKPVTINPAALAHPPADLDKRDRFLWQLGHNAGHEALRARVQALRELLRREILELAGSNDPWKQAAQSTRGIIANRLTVVLDDLGHSFDPQLARMPSWTTNPAPLLDSLHENDLHAVVQDAKSAKNQSDTRDS